jgi:hypothetical protein
VPLAGPVLEAPSPLGDLGAVPGVPSPVLGMDQPEALLSREVEGLGVVGQLSYGSRLGRASNGAPRLVEVPTEGLTMKSLMERMSAEPAVRTKGRSWPRCQK